jgi:tetratricopeptide (TPR) repeat protein
MRIKPHIFQAGFLILLGLLVYANSATIPTFHYDDDLTILTNPAVRSLDPGPIWQSFKTRFIPGMSFAVNYALAGYDAQAYHKVNVGLHVLTTLLVWAFLRQLLWLARRRRLIARRFSRWIPFLAAMVFLVHPVQTEPVNFVTQRYVLWAALFYMAALGLYLRWRMSGSRPAFCGALAACVAAMFCKEIAFSLPVMVMIVEIYFFRRPQEPARRTFKRLAPFLLTMAIIPLTLATTTTDMPGTARVAQLRVGRDGQTTGLDITRAASGFSRKEYALTQLNVIRTYMRLLVWPVNQNLDYDYPVTRKLLNGPTLLSLLLIAGLLYGARYLYTRDRLVSFGIVWFFVTLAVESSVIPIAHVIAEYRLYLATMGFALVAVIAISRLAKDAHGLRMTVFIWVAVLALAAHGRNEVWQSRRLLWEDTIEKSPFKVRPNVNLGKLYTQAGKLQEAAAFFHRAIQRAPDDPRNTEAYTNLGVVFVKMGRLTQAIEMHQKAVALNPNDPIPYYNLSVAYYHLGDLAKEKEYYHKAVAKGFRAK